MARQTIQEYLVGLGFQVDQGSVNTFQNAVKGADSTVKGLGSKLVNTSKQVIGFLNGLRKTGDGAKQANQQVKQLAIGVNMLNLAFKALQVIVAGKAAKKIMSPPNASAGITSIPQRPRPLWWH